MHLWVKTGGTDCCETLEVNLWGGGIHSSQRESKRVEKKIENRKAAHKRKEDEKRNHFTKGISVLEMKMCFKKF